MKRKSVYTCLVMLLMSLALQAKDKDVAVAEALLKRLLPSYIESFQFQKLKGEKDCFTIESVKDKIVIGGNNANSMAMGLNHYLKYYCLTTVSWYADIAVEIPEELPMVGEKVVSEARVDTRFFLNYCTYGYTMPWWQWKEWERFIDWMALNGINMPLAITGQEAVWYKVWSKMGMSDIEIRSYFTGPPYLPWHRMANIDRWNGPLPMEWLEHQVSLQKKILARERELNMKPVLPAFAGHVPADLKRIYPEADIQHLGKWAGFADAYRCNFLNPNDALFAKIQKLFLDEQKKLFGTDHVYGLDPFNEVDPPSFEPEYLRKIASDMYATLTAADPKAQWMQMTWMFYFDKDKWTSERMKALLTGVPQNKMILLDYHCENVELWKRTEHFHNQPYIWCYLGNFGGNTTLTGNVKESGERLENALINGGGNLKGIGSTLEGLDVMQFPYEYILEKAWNLNVDDDKWIECLADRHVGCVSQPVRDAWKRLFNDIYAQVPRTLGTLPGYRPALNKNSEKRTSNVYSNIELLEVWRKLNEAPSDRRDAFRLDLITVGRQVLGNYFLDVKMEFDRMVEAKDYQALKACGEKMKEILNDLDKLNAYVTLEGISLLEVTLEELHHFAAGLHDIGIHPRSQARILSGIRSFYKFLLLEDYIQADPTELLESPKIGFKLPDVLTVEEIDSIISTIDLSQQEGQRNRAILEVLYSCGLRVSELCNLKLSELYLQEGFIKVEGKGNKQRLVPISPRAIDELERYFEERSSINVKPGSEDYVFLSFRRGTPLSRTVSYTHLRAHET